MNPRCRQAQAKGLIRIGIVDHSLSYVTTIRLPSASRETLPTGVSILERRSNARLVKLCAILGHSTTTSTRCMSTHSRGQFSDMAAKIPPSVHSWRPKRLYEHYNVFTHGGLYWTDQYLLERWDRSQRPVVYREHVYGGYKLLRRLGSWCWLTQDPHTGCVVRSSWASCDSGLPQVKL